MELPLILSPDISTPLYLRLASSLKDAIDAGRLLQGQMMPSSRDLSQSLGISRDTIVKCYNELIREGLIYTISGGGTYVRSRRCMCEQKNAAKEIVCCAACTVEGSSEQKAQPPLNLSPSPGLSRFARERLRARELHACAGDQANINYGATPADLLPIRQWKELIGRNLSTKEAQALDYTSEIFGFRPLREQLSSYLRRTQAVAANTDQIAVFNDSQNAITLLAQILIDPGDLVAVENPGYGTAREVFRAYGAEVVEFPVDEEGICVKKLAQDGRHFKLVHVTPSHHDPLGTPMSLARRKELLDWAGANCVYILEDAFDSDIQLGAPPLPSLQGMSAADNVIFIHSFWKTLFPLTATGCLIVPGNLVETLTRLKRHTDRSSSIIERYALSNFLAEGHMERHLARLKPILRGRRNAVLHELTRAFQDRIVISKESAGLHFVVRFNLLKSSREILACAQECGFPLVSTVNYYASNPRINEFLVPFASIEEEQAVPLIKKFAAALI